MKDIIKNLFKKIDYERVDFGFEIVFPDGDKFIYNNFPIAFRVIFKTDKALKDFISRGSMGFLERYMNQDIDIEGDFFYVAHLGLLVEQQGLEPNLIEKNKNHVSFSNE